MQNEVRRYSRVADGNNGRGRPVGLAIAQLDPLNSEVVRLGFSRCSDNDTFDRNRATVIAEGRLNSGNFSYDRTNESLFDVLPEGFEDMHETVDWVVGEVVRRSQKVEA